MLSLCAGYNFPPQYLTRGPAKSGKTKAKSRSQTVCSYWGSAKSLFRAAGTALRVMHGLLHPKKDEGTWWCPDSCYEMVSEENTGTG